QRLAKVPEVSSTLTLETFIPTDQDQKLADIRKARTTLEPGLHPKKVEPAPSDEEVVGALASAAEHLTQVIGTESGTAAAAAKRLSDLLTRAGQSDEATRVRLAAAFVPTLNVGLDQLRDALKAERVTRQNLPPELAAEWITKDGRARVEV